MRSFFGISSRLIQTALSNIQDVSVVSCFVFLMALLLFSFFDAVANNFLSI